jgi:hypothetical protein
MIELYGRKLTPKQAANALIEEALDVLEFWEGDTSVGQDIEQRITARERQAVDEQVDRILARMRRYLN